MTRRILRLYERGMRPAAIARAVDRSRQRVHQVLLLSGEHQPRDSRIAERRNKVMAMSRAGLTGTQIADELGVSTATIYKDQAEAGLPRTRSLAARQKRRDRVQKLAKKGMTGAQIADWLGLNRKVIYRDMKVLGLSVRSCR